MMKKTLGAALAIAALAMCGGARTGDSAPAPQAGQETPAAEPQPEESEKMTLTGTLERTVEAGGWVLNTDEKKTYVLMFDRKYESEDWFKPGAKVKVTGSESHDTVSIFMQGTHFKVEKMEPVQGGTPQGNR